MHESWLKLCTEYQAYKSIVDCNRLTLPHIIIIVHYSPLIFESGPSGCFQLAPETGSHHGAAATAFLIVLFVFSDNSVSNTNESPNFSAWKKITINII